MNGGGRPVKNKEFDDQLARWVRELRGKKLRVSRKMLQVEARKLLENNRAEDEGDKLKRPIKKREDKFRNSLNLCWEGTNWMNNQIVEQLPVTDLQSSGLRARQAFACLGLVQRAHQHRHQNSSPFAPFE